MTNQAIVGDNSPLIALAIIGKLEFLPKLYQRLMVPTMVWEVVADHGAGLPGASAVSQLAWLKIQGPTPELLQPLEILVDRGEAQVIALVLGMPGSAVLLDDAQARRVAKRFGVIRIGTLGILRRAKKTGLIGAIKPCLIQLQDNGIYIRKKMIDAVLHDVGELA